jgi:hypothetical protein
VQKRSPKSNQSAPISTEGLLPGALEEQMAVYTAVTYALASSNAEPSLNSNGVVEWGIKNIVREVPETDPP